MATKTTATRCPAEAVGRVCHHACLSRPEHGGKHWCMYCALHFDDEGKECR